MNSANGSLCGNSKYSGDAAGGFKSGQVLTMQMDTDAGTLKFWLDGNPHGPGYTSGVTGPLRWAATVANIGNTVEIVPTSSELQACTPEWEDFEIEAECTVALCVKPEAEWE